MFIFEVRVFKLGRKICPGFKLKYFNFEEDPLNIEDFMAQNIIFWLLEGYSTVVDILPIFVKKYSKQLGDFHIRKT